MAYEYHPTAYDDEAKPEIGAGGGQEKRMLDNDAFYRSLYQEWKRRKLDGDIQFVPTTYGGCNCFKGKNSHFVLHSPLTSFTEGRRVWAIDAPTETEPDTDRRLVEPSKAVNQYLPFDHNEVFVNPLPLGSTAQTLWRIFDRFDISGVVIPRRHSRPVQYGFVEFRTTDEARRAIKEKHKTMYKGCRLTVQVSNRKMMS